MMQSLFSARMAIRAQQSRVDIIANNIANINTYGFKSSRLDFKDALYAAMLRPVDPGSTNLQQGTGVLIAATRRSFLEGAPMQTGVPLDFCIEGDGFFTVRDGQGNVKYTRNGCFAVSTEADGKYLVTSQGYYVLGTDGNRIKLPDEGLDQLTAGSDGSLSIGNEDPFATLNIASFANNEGLEGVGDNCFSPTEASGPAQGAEGVAVKQGFLEGSNVDLALEMTRLVRAQRAFTLAGNALSTADNMDAAANNLRA